MTNKTYKRNTGHNKYRAWIGLRGPGWTGAKLAVAFDMDEHGDWDRQIKERQDELLKDQRKDRRIPRGIPRDACKIDFRPDAYVVLDDRWK